MDGNRSGMFCVVDFVRGRQRTVVPDTWISVNDTLCLMPANATDSEVEVLVRNLAEPGEGWQILEINSVETFESYSEAKKQLEKSRKTSQSEANSFRRKRKKPSYLEDYSTRDSDDGRKSHTVFGTEFDEEAMSENEWIPPPEFNPSIESVSSLKKTVPNDHRARSRRFNQSQMSSQKENIDITCDCKSSCHSTFLQALHSMQKQLNRTNQMVQQLLGGQKETHSQLKRILQPQPVNQMNAPEEMDVFTQDCSNFVQCVLQNPSTSGTQITTENAITFSEVEDTYITGDQPSTSEELETKFNESLRKQVKLALKEFQTEDIERVLTTLETLGVKNKDHLKYVKSSDLLEVLNEVQARILVESFQTYCESGKPESLRHLPQHETKLPEADKDCIINISWNKMSSELVANLKSNKELKLSSYREMVRVIADDIIHCNINASRSFIKSVAEFLVKKFPILKDKFEDVVIGSGFDTLAYKLAWRVEHLRRNSNANSKKGDNQDAKCKKKKASSPHAFYGCVAWAPNIPDKETLENLEKKKRRLLEMDVSKDYVEIRTLMQDTYSLQRKEINGGADVKTLMSEWPFLFKMQGMLDHFKVLTDLDIRQRVKSIINEKCKDILAFFHSSDKVKVKTFLTENDTTSNKLLLLFTAIALYFDENPSQCIRASEAPNPLDDNKVIPSYPCLIGRGTSALKASEFMICVDKVVLNNEIKDGDFAVMMLFATYYVLNLSYPLPIALTLEFFQRCLIGINPPTGSKMKSHGKSYPRLLKVVNELKIFEQWLATSTTT